MYFYLRPVRRIGTEIRSGPVRSSVSDRSRTDLGPDRFDENFFDGAKFLKTKIWSDAIDFVKKSSKSEPSSRFLSRLKVGKFVCHFWANSADRPRIYIETLYKSNIPRDVCLNSLKSGGWHFKETLVADMMI